MVSNFDNKSNIAFPDQENTLSAKEQEKWWRTSADYVLEQCLASKDVYKIDRLYDNLEGIYQDDEFDEVLKPYGTSQSQMMKDIELPGQIRNVSLIKPIIEKKMGRFIVNRPVYQVVVNNADVVFNYNEELGKLVKNLADQLIINKLNELGVSTGLPSEEVANIEAQVKKFKSDWLDERAIRGQDIIDALYNWTDSDLIYYTAYFDYLVTGEAYSCREITDFGLNKEVVRPNEFWGIDNGRIFAEDQDMQVRKKKISFFQFLNKYGSKISNKDKEYLKSLSYDTKTNSGVTVPLSLVISRSGWLYPDLNDARSSDMLLTDSKGDFELNHIVWTTRVKKGILYRMNNLGMIDQIEVEDSYKVDTEIGDLYVDWEWYNAKYEVYRAGDKYTGVYFGNKLCDIQRFDLGGYCCKSMYNGIKWYFPNAGNPSYVHRLNDYNKLYAVYTYQLERILSKEVNSGHIQIIPASILSTDVLKAEQNMVLSLIDGKMIVDDSEISDKQGVGSLLRTLDTGLGSVISDLINVRKELKQEAWDSIGWNRQIDGDILASDGKSNTDRAINIAATGGILMDEIFNKFVEKDLQADLDYSKVVFVDHTPDSAVGSFVSSDDGAIRSLTVDGKDHALTEYGVFVKNNARERQKLDQYVQWAFNASQNGELGLASMAIEATSSTKLRKYIEKWDEAKKAYQERVDKMNSEAIKEKTMIEAEIRQQEIDLELYKIDKASETSIEVARINGGVSIQNTTISNSGNSDAIKQRMDDRKASLQEVKDNNDRRLKEEELRLKEKQIDASIKIANQNKNKYDK